MTMKDLANSFETWSIIHVGRTLYIPVFQTPYQRIGLVLELVKVSDKVMVVMVTVYHQRSEGVAWDIQNWSEMCKQEDSDFHEFKDISRSWVESPLNFEDYDLFTSILVSKDMTVQKSFITGPFKSDKSNPSSKVIITFLGDTIRFSCNGETHGICRQTVKQAYQDWRATI